MATGFSREDEEIDSLTRRFDWLLQSPASTMHPRSSQDDLGSLIGKIGSYPSYPSITHFYHVTNLYAKNSIDHTKMLRGSVANMTKRPSNLSPIHGKLKGVFFGCNLQNMFHTLPNRSPFGTERIKIPIEEFADPGLHLFHNSHHNTQSSVYYVILVLVKESSPDYKYCRERMIELGMESNKILRLNFERGKFEYCQPANFSLWVEVFIPGDIPLEDLSYLWDNVTDTGRHQSGPRPSPTPYGYGTILDLDDDDFFFL